MSRWYKNKPWFLVSPYLFFSSLLFSLLLILGDSENGSNSRKRFQRVEILKIAEPCPLIDPSQVVVTQGEILVADPVLTPIGTVGDVMMLDMCPYGVLVFQQYLYLHVFRSSQLYVCELIWTILSWPFPEKIRRKDLEVARALEEKHRLVAEYYQIPVEPCEVTDLTSTSTLTSRERDAREVLLAALVQGKKMRKRPPSTRTSSYVLMIKSTKRKMCNDSIKNRTFFPWELWQ